MRNEATHNVAGRQTEYWPDLLRAAGMGTRMGHPPRRIGAYIPAARRSGVAIRLGRDTLLACGVTRTGRASEAADKGGEELLAALRQP